MDRKRGEITMPFFIDEKGLPTCCGKRLLRPCEPYCGLCNQQYDAKQVYIAVMKSGKLKGLLGELKRSELHVAI
jgi:hypothetical protein